MNKNAPAPNAPESIVSPDPWGTLRQFTDARIALGRSGVSLPLKESLSFRLDHARARDAVHAPFMADDLIRQLEEQGLPCLDLRSAVADRGEYLTRPDLGRRLDDASRDLLLAHPQKGADVCLVASDGLSSRAIHENCADFIRLFARAMAPSGLTLSPVCVVRDGRVAVADEVGQLLEAKLSIILIGERPGLSSPDSMGCYLTWSPKVGNTDEARNCISNIRKAGYPVREGVRKLAYLVEEAFAMQGSGVGLKDRMTAGHLPFGRELPALD